jgi:hypothetical protein
LRYTEKYFTEILIRALGPNETNGDHVNIMAATNKSGAFAEFSQGFTESAGTSP